MNGGDYVACSRDDILTFPKSVQRDLLLTQMSSLEEGHTAIARYCTSTQKFASATVEVRFNPQIRVAK